ncbi:MAG: hypothetical protein ABSH20_09945 [Tepidisphaeraceae bacterium]
MHRFKTVMSLMCIMLTVTGGCGHRTALRQPATPTTTATARADATRPAAWYQLITVSEATADLRDQDDIQNDPVETVFAVYPSYSNLGLSREEAFKVLLVTNTYAPGVFEGGARTSGQCWAMRTLFQQPDVRDALLDLLNRAGMAGQLHALLGLYLLDRPAFDRHAPRYQADRRGVNTFFGCIHVERRVCDVVGAFRYINTKDALRDLQE